ncbi:MAG: HlyD family efflux transporter periplasmic adaptor subunit [Pseudohongiellaceae bacterium]
MNRGRCLLWLAAAFLYGCEEAPDIAVGQLESDRIEVVAESSEAITEIRVVEGDSVTAGAVLLSQNSERLAIREAELRASIARFAALLEEQLNGPRQEVIAATRASLDEVRIDHAYRARDLQRLQGLRERNLTSIESVDLAERQLATAAARIDQVSARLAELEAGTRPEQIAQTRAQLAQANAQLAAIELDQARLEIAAPVAGIVDSLPFETGERPRIGSVVVVLLAGEQPYARVYISEPRRVDIAIGTQLPVTVDGIADPLPGTVRRIAAEPSFTPYFALTERDRSRLSYIAEISLPTTEPRLPDGVPVQVRFP